MEPKETIVCVASGPSLRQEDLNVLFEYRRDLYVLAVNDAIRLAPWADIHYAAEERWWEWHQEALHYPSRKFTLDARAAERWPIDRLYETGLQGLELRPWRVRTGGHSGYTAVNLAVHFRPQRIVLLGYDMQPDASGRNHFFGEHPDGSHLAYAARLRVWPSLVEALTAETSIELVNATRDTALKCVPRVNFDHLFPVPEATADA